MDHKKCGKHKGTVNCITVEFPVSNCPWCKKEKAEAERDGFRELIETVICQITLSTASILSARPSDFSEDYPISVPTRTIKSIQKSNETIRVQVCNLIDVKVAARKIINHKEE